MATLCQLEALIFIGTRILLPYYECIWNISLWEFVIFITSHFYQFFSCFTQPVRSHNPLYPGGDVLQMMGEINTVIYSRPQPRDNYSWWQRVGGRSRRDLLSAVWDVLLWHRGVQGRHEVWVTKSALDLMMTDCDVSRRGIICCAGRFSSSVCQQTSSSFSCSVGCSSYSSEMEMQSSHWWWKHQNL